MWENFKHKTVRDLAWAVSSNGLLYDRLAVKQSLLREEYQKFIAQLSRLDKDPKLLLEFMETKNIKRLGHYFEQLIFFWLQHSERFTIIAKNTPLRSNKRNTLGEVDLIVHDQETLNYEHWELAVKFYLANHSEGKTNYIGPNANDYFHLKLKKLKEHQCKILESKEGKGLLAELNISNVKTKLFVKGFLFYHPKQESTPWENIHPDHAQSWWIFLNQAEQFLDEDHLFALVYKNEWLSTPDMPKNLLEKKECLEHLHQELKNSTRSLYLACYKNSELMSQGFVVHNKWPDLKA